MTVFYSVLMTGVFSICLFLYFGFSSSQLQAVSGEDRADFEGHKNVLTFWTIP